VGEKKTVVAVHSASGGEGRRPKEGKGRILRKSRKEKETARADASTRQGKKKNSLAGLYLSDQRGEKKKKEGGGEKGEEEEAIHALLVIPKRHWNVLFSILPKRRKKKEKRWPEKGTGERQEGAGRFLGYVMEHRVILSHMTGWEKKEKGKGGRVGK